MAKSNKRTPPIFYVGLVMLVLVLFSTHMTGGLYARFISRAEGSDDARVAKFDVAYQQVDAVPMKIELDFFDPGKRQDSIQFVVVSTSEVAVKYDVILVLPGKMTQWVKDDLMTIKLGDSLPKDINTDTKTITFDGGAFGATGTREDEHTLTFTITSGAMPGEIIQITEPATLRIHVEQID